MDEYLVLRNPCPYTIFLLTENVNEKKKAKFGKMVDSTDGYKTIYLCDPTLTFSVSDSPVLPLEGFVLDLVKEVAVLEECIKTVQ